MSGFVFLERSAESIYRAIPGKYIHLYIYFLDYTCLMRLQMLPSTVERGFQGFAQRWRTSEYSGLLSGSLLEKIMRLREALAAPV